MSGDDEANQHRFVALDGLRGVAALAVAIMHLHQTARFKSPVPMPASLAVDFFFMLSGFVLAYAYFDRLNGGVSRTEFIRARLIRLYPLIPAGVLLGAMVSLLKQQVQGSPVLGESFFAIPFALILFPVGLVEPRPTPNFSFDPPLWSLFFELLASAALATKVRHLRGWTLIGFLIILGILDASVTSIRVQSDIIERGGILSLLINVPRTAFAFSLGIVLFRSNIWRRVPRIPVVLVGGALGIALTMPGENGPIYNLAVLFILLPAAVLLAANAKPVPATAGICAFLGDLSYPLYVLHFPVGRAVIYAIKGNIIDDRIQTAIAVSVSTIVSWVALKAYDEPVRRWLRGRVTFKPGGAVA